MQTYSKESGLVSILQGLTLWLYMVNKGYVSGIKIKRAYPRSVKRLGTDTEKKSRIRSNVLTSPAKPITFTTTAWLVSKLDKGSTLFPQSWPVKLNSSSAMTASYLRFLPLQ